METTIYTVSALAADDLGGMALEAIATLREKPVYAAGASIYHAGAIYPPARGEGRFLKAQNILRNFLQLGEELTDAKREAADAVAHIERRIEETARRIVETDVCYCVSSLVSNLARRDWDGSDGVDPDALASLFSRQPDADDYRDAARDAGIFDTPQKPGPMEERIEVYQDQFKVWSYKVFDTDGDESDRGTADGTEAGAWRAAFDAIGQDHPDGSECLEHWLVTKWLAEKLEEHGEAVSDDAIDGLTIWGRCTSGQAIAGDWIIERIARDILEA
jgi:hypothetical protein